MFPYKTYLGCFLLSLLITACLTPWVARLALWLGFVDRPVNRKIHKQPVPLLGGLAIFIGMWLPLSLLFLYDNRISDLVQTQGGRLLKIFLAGFIMLIVGLIDDKRGLNAKWKFAAQVPVAVGLVAAGVRFEGLTIPFLGHLDFGAAAPVLSVLWLVGITNALNLIDGIDGLATGVAMLTAATIAFLAIDTDRVLVAAVMCSVTGACLGFLRHNFHPAKIFLGDAGSLFLGMTLAVSGAVGSVKAHLGASLLVPAVLLGYPIADTLLAMVRRYLRGKAVFSGDASHIHHRLLQKGLDQRKTCYVIYFFCFGLCLWTVALQFEHLGSIILGTVILPTMVVLAVHRLGYWHYFKWPKATVERDEFKAAHLYMQKMKGKFATVPNAAEVLRLLADISRAFDQTGLEIELPAGPAWPQLNQPTDTNFTSRYMRDQYQFDDTGLIVIAFHEAHGASEDFWMEKRTLFEEICITANERLVQLRRETTGTWLPPRSAFQPQRENSMAGSSHRHSSPLRRG